MSKPEPTTYPPLFANGMVYCPLCSAYFRASSYLKDVIKKPKTLWLANMVTHYRHNHIKSWNRCWDYHSGSYYRGYWFGDYHEEKSKINERAKRQIIRKATNYLVFHEIRRIDFEGLEYNDPKTIALIKKKLTP